MLSTRQQKSYLDKIKKEAHAQLKKIASSFNPDDLHQFRLSIKKMKSFGRFCCPSESKNLIAPLKMAFIKSGEVRDLINAVLIADNHFIFSTNTRNKWRREYNNAYRDFAFEAGKYWKQFGKTWNYLRKEIRPVPFNRIDNFFKSELVKTGKYFGQNKNASLHDGRKRLKYLLHLYRMLPRSIKEKLPVRVDYMDSLQDEIGKWHDLSLAEPILKKKINRIQMQVIRKEKENILEKTLRMSAHFLEKATILHGSKIIHSHN
jgi:CHAD domain-containing protein